MRMVVDRFVADYTQGRTPIPCTRCNSDLKFSTLLERAGALEADALATGHYARVGYDEDRRHYVLRRGVDRRRDQSYFLFALTQAQLARARFPVGEMEKAEVREYARSRNLPVAEKPESRDICFVPDGDYAGFIERRDAGARDAAGVFVDASGRELGRHGGVHRFTVGQRKGLGLSAPAPLYVLSLDAGGQRVLVGPRFGAGARVARGDRGVVDGRGAVGRAAAGAGPDPLPACRGARGADAGRRRRRALRLRGAAAGGGAGPGRRLLRRRRGHRRRVDLVILGRAVRLMGRREVRFEVVLGVDRGHAA